MLPIPATGEWLLIAVLVFVVFFGEKVTAIGDAIGRRRAGKSGPAAAGEAGEEPSETGSASDD